MPLSTVPTEDDLKDGDRGVGENVIFIRDPTGTPSLHIVINGVEKEIQFAP